MVAMTSGMGSIGESSGGYVPYRSSKAALNMAWHSLAIEAKRSGVIAAVFDPGWVKTRMGGAGAPTPPEQSVADMRRLIERLGLDDSGNFLKRDGSRHGW
jgi:NAD(P)-dependent dehydrogenase (short-subunit alcohol dehydrogenase family)